MFHSTCLFVPVQEKPPLGTLLRQWHLAGFAPDECQRALEALIQEQPSLSRFFAPSEITRGGLFSTDALFYDLFAEPIHEYDLSLGGVALRVDAEEGAPITAALLRMAASHPDASWLDEVEGIEHLPEEFVAALRACYQDDKSGQRWLAPGAPGIYRREHASLLLCSSTTKLLLDPQRAARGWTTNDGQYPQDSAAWRPDAILLTHSHNDHFDLASILLSAQGEEVPVIVPWVKRPNLLCEYDMAALLRSLGQEARAPRWGETLTIGDFEIDVLPFYGEQPTRFAPGAQPDLRNWGSCYRFQCPEFSAMILVDSGVDPMGSAIEMVAESCRRRGPVDILLSCCASFPEGLNAGLPHYATTLPFAQLRSIYEGSRAYMTLGAAGVAQACRAAQARYFMPYAHGFQGLGKDPVSPEMADTESMLVARVSELVTETKVQPWSPGDVVHVVDGSLRVTLCAG